MKAYYDSDHAGEDINCHSKSQFFTMLNIAPIDLFSNNKTSVVTSTFGSEFVALKQ